MRQVVVLGLVVSLGCGASDSGSGPLPYAASVESFEPGAGAGFGEDELPDVVLGPPMGTGVAAGSLDVLSLGMGGEIVLGFGERAIVDGEGPDFIVFENAFYVGGDPDGEVFAEPGEVSVSEDGESWQSFHCEAAEDPAGFAGCAGVMPTLSFDPAELMPLDPALTGGDAFDLAELGMTRARYVKVRDLSDEAEGMTAGFDLDAVGMIHHGRR